jgi:hypothetical protein
MNGLTATSGYVRWNDELAPVRTTDDYLRERKASEPKGET